MGGRDGFGELGDQDFVWPRWLAVGEESEEPGEMKEWRSLEHVKGPGGTRKVN